MKNNQKKQSAEKNNRMKNEKNQSENFDKNNNE